MSHNAMAMEGFDGRGRPILGDWWKTASCAEVDCPKYLLGFRTMLDETRADMKDAADWIRYKSDLHFTESQDPEGLTVFDFPPGQPCWESSLGGHRQPTGKPGKLSKTTPSGPYVFTRGRDFNESWNEEADAARERS